MRQRSEHWSTYSGHTYRRLRFSLLMAQMVPSMMGCGNDVYPWEDESTNEQIAAIDSRYVRDCTIAWEKELMITDFGVVKDGRATGLGPWSFGGIVRALAGEEGEREFMKRFVESWLRDQEIDGVVVKARPAIQERVLAPWKALSASGTYYDPSLAPFVLLAIVYRPDLHEADGIGSGAGEGRFVYGVRNGEGEMMPFTVIVEFELPKRGGWSTKDWAEEWHYLGNLALGSAAYNNKLEEITNRFASANARASENLNQIRTNEIALDLGTGHAPVWQLREFKIGLGGYLRPAHPALTPLDTLNATETLTRYVRQNERTIGNGRHHVPLKFEGKSFAGASSNVPNAQFTWAVPNVSSALASSFSRQTCNGCHAGDTGTRFLHVGPNEGGPAQLSSFVTNVEIPRRMAVLEEVLDCD